MPHAPEESPTRESRAPLLGVRCGRCGYDLRGGTPGQRCPECGTKIPRPTRTLGAGDTWQTLTEGVRWSGQSLVLAIPAFFFAPLSPTIGTAAVAALAVQAWCQVAGLRDLRRAFEVEGLAAERTERRSESAPDLPRHLASAHRASLIHRWIAAPLGCLALAPAIGPSLLGPTGQLPGGSHLLLFAALLPSFLLQLLSTRALWADLAALTRTASAGEASLRGGRIIERALAPLGVTILIAWAAVALVLIADPTRSTGLFGFLIAGAVFLSLPMAGLLGLLVLQSRELIDALPRSPRFSAAARRVAEQRRGPHRIASPEPRRKEDDEPIRIVDD
jgi:hypothetical protein